MAPAIIMSFQWLAAILKKSTKLIITNLSDLLPLAVPTGLTTLTEGDRFYPTFLRGNFKIQSYREQAAGTECFVFW
jgi:hypothetical protein